MNTLYKAITSNIKAASTLYRNDIQYLNDLNINNTLVKDALDVDMLLSTIDSLDKVHSIINKYEAWLASSFDHHYGWDIIPSRYIKQYITDALDKFNKLYLKVIDNRIINLYSEDCTDRNKLVISFSVISD